MKKIKTIIKKTTLLGASVFALFGSLQLAQAQGVYGDLSGSYIGKSNVNGNDFHLALRSAAADGREDSYFAVLVQTKPLAIAVYLVDPNEDASLGYDMKPLNVTSDGEMMGIENANPSLTMHVEGVRDNHFVFTLVKANENLNTAGFPGPITFNSAWGSKLQWLDAANDHGIYTDDKNGTKFFFPSTFIDNQTGMTITEPNFNGNFILRQSLNGIYTYRRISSTDVGNILAQYPEKIILFLRDPNIFSGFSSSGSEFAVMVDPGDLTNPYALKSVTKLIRRPWNN